MPFVARRPPPALRRFVAWRWWYEGHSPPHTIERTLPTAAMQLVVNLRSAEILVAPGGESARLVRLRGAVLARACDSPVVIATSQQAACAGVLFRPGRAFPFLGGYPAADLQDAHVSLETLWGSFADQLHARLTEARDPSVGLALREHGRIVRHRCC